MKLFIGFDWSSKRKKENTYPFCFLSVAVPYSFTQGKSLPAWKINNAKEIMLDSGGFSFHNKYGDYPFSTKKYVNWIKEMNKINDNKITYVAIRDYPCEPDLMRNSVLKDNFQRIKKTVENTKECMSFDISPAKWMPVLQGYIDQDYLTCYQMLFQKNLLTNYIAIGSMCRRTDIIQIRELLQKIKRSYSGRLHLFGLTINAVKDKYIFDNVESCDTIGYTYNCKTLQETFDKQEELIKKFNKASFKNNCQQNLSCLFHGNKDDNIT